jgi:hypothetical protein
MGILNSGGAPAVGGGSDVHLQQGEAKGVGVGPLGLKKGGTRGELTGEAELAAAWLQFRCGGALQWRNLDRRQAGKGRGVSMAREEEEKGKGNSGDAAAPFQSGAVGI